MKNWSTGLLVTDSQSIQFNLSCLITAVKSSFFRHYFTILTLSLWWVKFEVAVLKKGVSRTSHVICKPRLKGNLQKQVIQAQERLTYILENKSQVNYAFSHTKYLKLNIFISKTSTHYHMRNRSV